MQFKTVEYGIKGEGRLRAVVERIITESQWFSVTPYPDDYWVVRMKEENERMLRNFAGSIGGELIERNHGEESQTHEA